MYRGQRSGDPTEHGKGRGTAAEEMVFQGYTTRQTDTICETTRDELWR